MFLELSKICRNIFLPSTVINSNTNGLSVVLAQSSSLQFLKSESSTCSDLDIVFVGRAVDHWSQLSKRSWSNPCCLGCSGLATADLPGWLVEPSLDIVLPIFVKVAIWYDVVSFRWHLL